MVSTRKKRQSNRRLLSQIDDFDRDVIIGNAVNGGQQNVVVNKGTTDGEITVNNSDSSSANNEITVNVQASEDVSLRGMTGKGVIFLMLR